MAAPTNTTAAVTTRLETLLDRPPVKLAGFAALGPAASIALEVGTEPRPIDSDSLLSAAGIPNAAASIHCDSERKYSSPGVSGAASTLSAMICLCFDAARSISRPTCEDPIELSDSTSTSVFDSLMARTMASQ